MENSSDIPEMVALSPTCVSLMLRYSSIIDFAFFFIAASVSSGVGETEGDSALDADAASGTVNLGDSLPPSRSWVLR